ncbi:MAG TPA: GNAT family N-acetyltransferase, partial [Ruminiclostridium sp.]|nr:GNAT family N-acetyltransferase [Ruminiclostridium sp.]
MIRKLNIEDKDRYIAMSKEFYSSDAVLHTIPEENIYKTFGLLTTGSPYAEG